MLKTMDPGSLSDRILARPLVLYGAGNAGRVAAGRLAAKGARIAAFLDESAAPDERRDGIPVFKLSAWLGLHRAGDCNALVTIFNPQVDVMPIIDRLRASGFPEVSTIVDYVNFCPEDTLDRLWLVPSAHYDDKREKLEATRNLLDDALSRRWFDGNLRLRTIGDFRDLPTHSHADQYMPAGLPRWANPLLLIDGGAFDGDTVQAFLNNGYDIEALAAFEPDPENYVKLSRRHAGLNAIFFPCGVSSTARQFRFDAGHGVSSRIGDGGALTIQCVSIDEAIPGFAPNLIKLDVEGTELDTLRGAERTLRRHRPALAVSVYHKPDDLLDIPLWLASLDLGYRMVLRGHGPSGFDLVLYCRAG